MLFQLAPISDLGQTALMLFLTNYALPAVFTALGTFLVVATANVIKLLRVKLGETRFAQLQAIVDQVVKAVEQSNLKEGLEQSGEEKLRTAITLVQQLLDERGLKSVSVETIVTVIRAALRDGVHKEYPTFATLHAISEDDDEDVAYVGTPATPLNSH